jgi:hypothetical protein
VPRYLRLRAQLRLFLGLAALNFGMSMLSLGISRNLLNEAFPSRPELFPAAPLVAYGVYFTGLIASGYVPMRKTLMDVGEALAEQLVRQSLGEHAPWKARFEERQAAFQELPQGIAVLAPCSVASPRCCSARAGSHVLRPRALRNHSPCGGPGVPAFAPGAKTPWNLGRFVRGGGTRDALRQTG